MKDSKRESKSTRGGTVEEKQVIGLREKEERKERAENSVWMVREWGVREREGELDCMSERACEKTP